MTSKYSIRIEYANGTVLKSRLIDIDSVTSIKNGIEKSLVNRSFFTDRSGAFNGIINPMAIVHLTVIEHGRFRTKKLN